MSHIIPISELEDLRRDINADLDLEKSTFKQEESDFYMLLIYIQQLNSECEAFRANPTKKNFDMIKLFLRRAKSIQKRVNSDEHKMEHLQVALIKTLDYAERLAREIDKRIKK
jgi:hypothetical protein